MINILIDELTNSIRHRETSTIFETQVVNTTLQELQFLKNWQFDWVTERQKKNVYKLTTLSEPELIQGLVSLDQLKGFVFINIIENAPFNIGKNGVYEGVGGNLFAYACKISFELGFEGFVAFDSKTELVKHYEKMLSAKRISQKRMIIDTQAAIQLVSQYFKNFKNEK